jgi:tetratricopeptide (TPR) repeat protein
VEASNEDIVRGLFCWKEKLIGMEREDMLNLRSKETTSELEGLAMVAKKENGGRPDFEIHEPAEMSPEEAKKEMEEFFGRLEEELKVVPQEVIQEGAQKVLDFIKGKSSWADIFNVTPETMKQMVELGYLKFQAGRLEEAERFFKVLSVLDTGNGYFRSMLGTILQRQRRFGEAIVQYTEALDLNPHDTVSLVNRGEIYLQHGWLNDAEDDFTKAISLDPKKEDKSANRARVFMSKVQEIRRRRRETEGKEEGKKKGKKGA